MPNGFAALKVFPPTVRCLRVEMLPYSLGQQFHLLALQSPFLGSELPGYDDLILAACICSNTWEENVRFLRSPMRQWLKLKVWGLLAGKFDVAQEIVMLWSHIRAAQEFPEQRPPQRGATVRHLFSDWETRLYTFLRSAGFSESEAMNMPLQQAHLMFAARLEEDGKLELKSKRDYAIDDALARACDAMPDNPEQSLPA